VGDGHSQYLKMREIALRIESLGYDSVWLYDHFHTVPEARDEATFEVWTAMAALAEATSTIRLGQMCCCNIYRPPALLAKQSSVVDAISNGRLEVGLGAGWYEHETVAYGYKFEKPSTRIGQLDEACQILLGMWTENRFQFEGKHYTVGVGRPRDYSGREVELDGVINHPKPIGSPHPPLWIGGGGEQLTLRTVARYANWANYGGSLSQVQHKNTVLDAHCDKIGRDPTTVKRSMNANVFLGEPQQLSDLLRASGRNPQEIASVLSMLMPTEPQALIDLLAAYRDQGRIEYVLLYFPDAVTGHSLDRFAQEVMPALRGDHNRS
jgi:alkanesulfonate monooxygenase SsuD/methylene tetrahydromethanopterin reductase-like flavin-dependent oxidoreductase (luciferase family)